MRLADGFEICVVELVSANVEPDLIATEILGFTSNSSTNLIDNDLTIGIPQVGRQLPYEL